MMLAIPLFTEWTPVASLLMGFGVLLAGTVWKLQAFIADKNSKLDKKIAETMTTVTVVNNTMTAAIQLAEMRVVEKFEPEIKQLDQQLNGHKLYSEQKFLSKDSFREVMRANTDDRKEFRDEVIKRFNSIDETLRSKM